MRLIDADALIKKAYDEAEGMAEPYDDFGVLVEWIVSKSPTIESEPKWIPTSKKPDPDLPEEEMSGYFLVTLHTYGNIGFDMDEYEVKKMRWNRVNGWVLPVHSPAWIEEALTQDITAWEPCPEPYREDGE